MREEIKEFFEIPENAKNETQNGKQTVKWTENGEPVKIEINSDNVTYHREGQNIEQYPMKMFTTNDYL